MPCPLDLSELSLPPPPNILTMHVATIDDLEGPTFTIKMQHGGKAGDMTLHRLIAPLEDGCPAPPQIHTAAIDGSQVYGTDEDYLNTVLREPGSCRLRTSESNMLPITTKADDKGRFFFLAGDARVDEHAMLTSMHTARPPAVCCAVLCGRSRRAALVAAP